jgi:hypothetical protein
MEVNGTVNEGSVKIDENKANNEATSSTKAEHVKKEESTYNLVTFFYNLQNAH